MTVSPRHDTRFATVALVASAAGVLSITFGRRRDNTAAAVAPVKQKEVPVYREWIGTLDGLVNENIEAQVTGYLMQQAYTEGTFVEQGQLAFQIEPRLFPAGVDQTRGRVVQTEGQLGQSCPQLAQAEAQVAAAETNRHRVQLNVDRYTPLVQAQAIPQQDFDDAGQNHTAAKAHMQAARPQVETARAKITAATAVETANAALETAQIDVGLQKVQEPS